MKVGIFLFLSLLLAAPVLAGGPYLVSSPSAGATSYNVQGLPSSINATGLSPDPSGTYGLKLDVSALPAGSYTVTATGCTSDPNWGQVCSAASLPFSLTRPGAPPVPMGMGLSVK